MLLRPNPAQGRRNVVPPRIPVQGQGLAALDEPTRIEGLYLPMAGWHNVSNSLAAIAVARELGVDDDSIRQGLAGDPMVPRQPAARRDLIHVDDAVAALQLIADHAAELPPVVNISTGRPIRTGDLAARIARLTGHEPPPEPAASAGWSKNPSGPNR